MTTGKGMFGAVDRWRRASGLILRASKMHREQTEIGDDGQRDVWSGRPLEEGIGADTTGFEDASRADGDRWRKHLDERERVLRAVDRSQGQGGRHVAWIWQCACGCLGLEEVAAPCIRRAVGRQLDAAMCLRSGRPL